MRGWIGTSRASNLDQTERALADACVCSRHWAMALLDRNREGLGSLFEDFSHLQSGELPGPPLVYSQAIVSNRKIPILSFLEREKGKRGERSKIEEEGVCIARPLDLVRSRGSDVPNAPIDRHRPFILSWTWHGILRNFKLTVL